MRTLARRVFKATDWASMDWIRAVRMRYAQRLLALGEPSLEVKWRSASATPMRPRCAN
jgi:hypothetical protein